MNNAHNMRFTHPGQDHTPITTTHLIGRKLRGSVLAIPERDSYLRTQNSSTKGRPTPIQRGLGAWDGAMKSTSRPISNKHVPGRNPIIMPERFCGPTVALTHRPTNITSKNYSEVVV